MNHNNFKIEGLLVPGVLKETSLDSALKPSSYSATTLIQNLVSGLREESSARPSIISCFISILAGASPFSHRHST